MRNVHAIFVKQAKDLMKTPAILLQFIVYPLMAFFMTEFVAKANADIPDNMFVTMFAPMFAGVALIMASSGPIAEDREHKSLRLLVMAGVKPHQYLLGCSGVNLVASLVVSTAFALMSGLSGAMFAQFLGALVVGSVASILLGSAIGMLCKNQQTATSLGLPIAMFLGFGPMVSMFNSTVEKVFSVFYTQQLSLIVNDTAEGFGEPLLIMGANIVVLLALFAVAYRKKGLRG